MEWLSACSRPGCGPEDFEIVPPKRRSLDTKLLPVLRVILRGDVATRVGTAIDEKGKERPAKLLSGRTVLCMVYKEFEPNG
eukprot:7921459-Heterocapsa_arctica.AAC.1